MQRLSSVCGPGQIPDDKRTIGAPPLHRESPDATPSAAFRSITLNRQSIPSGAALGALPRDEVAGAIERIVETYRVLRDEGERFIDTLRRVGLEPFRERAYAAHPAAA